MAGGVDTLEIRPDPAELARMRQFIRRRAAEHELDPAQTFKAQLVATEAATNAMRHGARADGRGVPIVVRCLWDQAELTIEVGDQGRFRHRAPSTPADIDGRGLGLIEGLTRQFELETSERGTTLRMVVCNAA